MAEGAAAPALADDEGSSCRSIAAEDSAATDQLLARELAALGPEPSHALSAGDGSSGFWPPLPPLQLHDDDSDGDCGSDDDGEPEVFKALRRAVARRGRFLDDVSAALSDVRQELGQTPTAALMTAEAEGLQDEASDRQGPPAAGVDDGTTSAAEVETDPPPDDVSQLQ
jgi:hypothetical protein